MDSKKWYRSKTIWGGIGSIATGIWLVYTKEVPAGIAAITTGLIAVNGRIKATKTIIKHKHI